jgi:hypothetical protein
MYEEEEITQSLATLYRYALSRPKAQWRWVRRGATA